jgi:hypothetical protein
LKVKRGKSTRYGSAQARSASPKTGAAQAKNGSLNSDVLKYMHNILASRICGMPLPERF